MFAMCKHVMCRRSAIMRIKSRSPYLFLSASRFSFCAFFFDTTAAGESVLPWVVHYWVYPYDSVVIVYHDTIAILSRYYYDISRYYHEAVTTVDSIAKLLIMTVS